MLLDVINLIYWVIALINYWFVCHMEVELDDFEDGRPVVFKTNTETAIKIK